MTKLTPRPTAGEGPVGGLRACEDPIRSLPILILYPHSRCNCRCTMCDIWRAPGKTELSDGDVRSMIPQMQSLGVRRVVLSGGEPLMHSDLWSICEALQSAGIGISLLSTGILLARHAEALVRYCDDIVVSLDGPAAVHDAIRNIPKAYDKLRRGVRAVKAADPRIHLSGRCTVQRANFHSLRATVASAHDMGLDRVSFLAADVSTEAFNRPGGWDSGRAEQVALGREDIPRLRAELDALQDEYADDFRSGYIAESPQKLHARLLQYFEALLGDADFPPIQCNAPWVSSVIESDGTVRPCYFHNPIGNLKAGEGLREILNSAQAIAWRRSLDIETNPICRRCVCSLALRDDTSLDVV